MPLSTEEYDKMVLLSIQMRQAESQIAQCLAELKQANATMRELILKKINERKE